MHRYDDETDRLAQAVIDHAWHRMRLDPVPLDGPLPPEELQARAGQTHHLTRRARGLPFWFSLAAHGTRAHSAALEQTQTVARVAAEEIRSRTYVELLRESQLSVVVLRRIGWTTQQYDDSSERLMRANFAFVTPTSHAGETVTRFAIVNPRTTVSDVTTILDTMA